MSNRIEKVVAELLYSAIKNGEILNKEEFQVMSFCQSTLPIVYSALYQRYPNIHSSCYKEYLSAMTEFASSDQFEKLFAKKQLTLQDITPEERKTLAN